MHNHQRTFPSFDGSVFGQIFQPKAGKISPLAIKSIIKSVYLSILAQVSKQKSDSSIVSEKSVAYF